MQRKDIRPVNGTGYTSGKSPRDYLRERAASTHQGGSMNTTADKLAAALTKLLSLNRTQGVSDDEYETAEAAGDAALAEYDAQSATPGRRTRRTVER